MTIYSDLQQNVSKFHRVQNYYWRDLSMKLIPFHQELINYLGVEEKILYTRDDVEIPVTVFGRIASESVQQEPVPQLDRDEENNALEFGFIIHLTEYGSEIVDDSLMFSCNFFKKNGSYFVTVTDTLIECPNNNSHLDFTPVFDFAVKRLYSYMNASIFE